MILAGFRERLHPRATAGPSLCTLTEEKLCKHRSLCSCCFPSLGPSIALPGIYNTVSLQPHSAKPTSHYTQSKPTIQPSHLSTPWLCSCYGYPWWNYVNGYKSRETHSLGNHSSGEAFLLWVILWISMATCTCTIHVYLILCHSLLFPNHKLIGAGITFYTSPCCTKTRTLLRVVQSLFARWMNISLDCWTHMTL